MPRPVALLVAALAATPLPLNSAAAQVRNGWWPRQVDLNDIPASDQAIMRRNLMAAEQLMTRTSGYANPNGFESVAAWRVQASSGPRDVREYWVEMGSYVPTRAAAGGATNASAWIRFNPSFGFLAEGAITIESGEVYYLEFPRSEARRSGGPGLPARPRIARSPARHPRAPARADAGIGAGADAAVSRVRLGGSEKAARPVGRE